MSLKWLVLTKTLKWQNFTSCNEMESLLRLHHNPFSSTQYCFKNVNLIKSFPGIKPYSCLPLSSRSISVCPLLTFSDPSRAMILCLRSRHQPPSHNKLLLIPWLWFPSPLQALFWRTLPTSIHLRVCFPGNATFNNDRSGLRKQMLIRDYKAANHLPVSSDNAEHQKEKGCWYVMGQRRMWWPPGDPLEGLLIFPCSS